MPLSLSEDLKAQKNKLEQKDPWIYLAEVELTGGTKGPWFRCTSHVEGVSWNGLWWQAFPMAVSDIKITSRGEMPTAQVIVSNAGRVLMDYMKAYRGLVTLQGNIYLVNLNFLGDPLYSVIPESFIIQSSSANAQQCVFNLALGVDVYGIEGPIESYDREKFPSMPIISPRISIGVI